MDLETILVGIFWIAFMAFKVYGHWADSQKKKARKAQGAPQGEGAGTIQAGGEDRAAAPPVRHQPEPAAEQSADILLPDDLWEILTGERRIPTPVPAPPAGTYEAGDSDTQSADESPEFEELTGKIDEPVRPGEWHESEHVVLRDRSGWSEDAPVITADREPARTPVRSRDPRELPDRSPREVMVRSRQRELISLDEAYDPAERRGVRHAATTTAPMATNRTGPGTARRRALRRAVILREVLGPPKGLEERL